MLNFLSGIASCFLCPSSAGGDLIHGIFQARVVSEVTEHGSCRIATRHGVVNTTYSRNQLQKSDCQLLDLEDTTIPEVHSFRKIASLHSALGGQGYSKLSLIHI